MKWTAQVKQKPQVDMVPLLDTIFLLLIFFIYSMSQMIVHKGLPIDLPFSTTASVSQSSFNTISIDAVGYLYLDKEKISDSQLDKALQGLSAQLPQPEIFIAADKQTPFEYVLKVMDSLRSKQFEKVSFETQEMSK